MTRCHFIPPYVLERLDQRRQLAIDEALRAARAVAPLRPPVARLVAEPAWTVHTAAGTDDLPGAVVRRAGEPESADAAVDEAAAGVTAALALFEEVYGRDSYDAQGAPVSVTVHYLRDYGNAFWDGRQLVFGDGDDVFDRLTKTVDVLAHELSHAVTQYTANFAYQDQSGALNESMSDVFASCVKQRLLGQGAEDADWLIGEGIFRPGIAGRALRDLRAPGTAYDNEQLGRDPQPAHLDDYVEGPDDNGGVHVNSGIPNRAFQLAAVAVGGSSWAGAGRIWYDALVGDRVGPDTDFAGFAAATVAAAGPHAEAVTGAWATVGVTAGPASGRASTTVRVRRSGGFAGRVTDAALDLAADPDLGALVDAVDVRTLRGGPPQPDRFVYAFDLCGREVTVPEQHLTPELRLIADKVLARPTDQ